MRIVALLALAILSGTLAAAPPEVVIVPAPKAGEWTELKVTSGAIVVLEAQPASEWDALDGIAPHTFESGKYATFLLGKGEKLKVIVTGPDKTKRRLLLIGSGEPPVPPKPNPPDPVDPLKAKIVAAVEADPAAAAEKAKAVKDLALLYRTLAAKQCRDPMIETVEEFLDVARLASIGLVDVDAPKGVKRLKGVREIVTAELGGFLMGGPFTDDQRKATAALFERLAGILESLP